MNQVSGFKSNEHTLTFNNDDLRIIKSVEEKYSKNFYYFLDKFPIINVGVYKYYETKGVQMFLNKLENDNDKTETYKNTELSKLIFNYAYILKWLIDNEIPHGKIDPDELNYSDIISTAKLNWNTVLRYINESNKAGNDLLFRSELDDIRALGEFILKIIGNIYINYDNDAATNYDILRDIGDKCCNSEINSIDDVIGEFEMIREKSKKNFICPCDGSVLGLYLTWLNQKTTIGELKQKYDKTFNKNENMGRINVGGQAIVYMYGRGDEKWALKEKENEDALFEYLIHSKLDNPYIIKILDYYVLNEPHHEVLLIQMPYIEYTLEGLLNEINPTEKYMIALQLLIALYYLHNEFIIDNEIRRIIHGDLKPLNILVEKENGRFKQIYLTDFGFARIMNSSQSVSMMGCTQKYMSPDDRVSLETDVYVFGLIYHQLLTNKIHKGNRYQDLEATGVIKIKLKDLLEQCLKKEKKNRCTISIVLAKFLYYPKEYAPEGCDIDAISEFIEDQKKKLEKDIMNGIFEESKNTYEKEYFATLKEEIALRYKQEGHQESDPQTTENNPINSDRSNSSSNDSFIDGPADLPISTSDSDEPKVGIEDENDDEIIKVKQLDVQELKGKILLAKGGSNGAISDICEIVSEHKLSLELPKNILSQNPEIEQLVFNNYDKNRKEMYLKKCLKNDPSDDNRFCYLKFVTSIFDGRYLILDLYNEIQKLNNEEYKSVLLENIFSERFLTSMCDYYNDIVGKYNEEALINLSPYHAFEYAKIISQNQNMDKTYLYEYITFAQSAGYYEAFIPEVNISPQLQKEFDDRKVKMHFKADCQNIYFLTTPHD